MLRSSAWERVIVYGLGVQALAAMGTGRLLVHLYVQCRHEPDDQLALLRLKVSSILGFNIFIQPAERFAMDFDEVIARYASQIPRTRGQDLPCRAGYRGDSVSRSA